jgi:hypothetical protein
MMVGAPLLSSLCIIYFDLSDALAALLLQRKSAAAVA